MSLGLGKAISGNGSWKDSAEESREAAFAGKEEHKEKIAPLENGGLSLNPLFYTKFWSGLMVLIDW